MTAPRAILYGVGSPYAADLEEVCRRALVELVGFVANVEGETFASAAAPLLRPTDLIPAYADVAFVVPLIGPAFRHAAAAEARALGLKPLARLVDPSAVVAASAVMGEGVSVNAAVVIGAASRLGEQVLVNRSASIGHHCVLEPYVTIGPGAVLAGGVRLGRGVFVGAGAVLLPEVEIGANTVVGAGAVVTRSAPAGCVLVGNPARVVKTGVAGYRDRGAP